ncbi:preprotein translocase subunit SecY, partial [Campylobacter jejuni]|nr:preprotein translocase subunit SecY [Campylobacter jejuni]
VITLVQSIGVAIGLQSLHGRGGAWAIMIEDLNMFIALCAISMLAVTSLLMWLVEQITQRGIGNGISLIIFAGIVSGIQRALSVTL